MKNRKILITMTAEDGESYIEDIRAAGFEPLLESMLDVEHIAFELGEITESTALVFTSSHALRAFAKKTGGRDYPLYLVGRSTAETARMLGFKNIEHAAGTGEDLAALLVQKGNSGLISPIYMRGEVISRDLKADLKVHGIKLHEIIVYKANMVEKLSINLLNSLDNREIYAVMLFSKRGATVFADLIEQYGRTVRLKTTKALCISDAVLKSVSVLPFQQAIVAGDSDHHGMMKLLKDISV